MAMEFNLTYNYLRDFIALAHKTLWVRPSSMKDDADWCNSFMSLIESINALLWHDTSDFNPDDKPEDEAKVITQHMKDAFRDRFFVMESKERGSTRAWVDCAAFADANVCIWLSFIPGNFTSFDADIERRANDNHWRRAKAMPIPMDFITSQLENTAKLFDRCEGRLVDMKHYAYILSDILLPNDWSMECLKKLISTAQDIDESMLDEYLGYHPELLDVLHEDRRIRLCSDFLYTVTHCIAQMMITDSIVATASYKLGEYISTVDNTTEDAATRVYDPAKDSLEAVEGELELDSKVEISHMILTVSRKDIESFVEGVVGRYTDTPKETPMSTFTCEELKSIYCFVAKELQPSMDDKDTDVLGAYLFQKTVDGERDASGILTEIIADELFTLMPRTLLRDFDNDQKVVDVTLYHYIGSYMSAYSRHIVSVAYSDRLMGIDPGFSVNSREVYEYMGQGIIESAYALAFDNLNMRNLIELYFARNDKDPLNATPEDFEIIRKLCLPVQAGKVTHEIIKPGYAPHPTMNFPDDVDDEPNEPEAENSVTYNFIYDIDGLKIDRFIVNPQGVRGLLMSALSTNPVDSKALDRMIIRLIFPHSTSPLNNIHTHYFRALTNFIRDAGLIIVDETSRANAMWTALNLMIPRWGCPDCCWNKDVNSGNDNLVSMSIDEVNHMVNAINANIWSRWGTQKFLPTDRPLGEISAIIRQHAYPQKIIRSFPKADMEKLRKLQEEYIADLLKIHILTYLKKLGRDVDETFMVTVGMDSDLSEFTISDEALSCNIFLSLVHTLPFDDISMNSIFDRNLRADLEGQGKYVNSTPVF